MADNTTTYHLKLTDGLSAAAQKAAASMANLGKAADKLNNKKVRDPFGLDPAALARMRSSMAFQSRMLAQRTAQESAAARRVLQFEAQMEAAARRRASTLLLAVKARQREAAEAAKAAAADRAHNSFRARTGRIAAGAGAVGAGAIAAGHVVAPRVQKALTYDMRKARLATTMAGDGTVADMQKAHAQIGDAVYRAIREGGGSRDDAIAGLDALVSSGKFEGRAALDALPAIVKTAYATGAAPEDIAKSAAAMIQAGVAAKDLQRGFDMMLKGGRVGAFELPDMARWMPQQLALAETVGMSGLDAVRQIVAANEVARATAGTSDETGNNVVNLLQKLTSRELKDTMAKTVDPKAGDPTTPGKVKGKGAKARRAPATFDWSKFMVQRQLQGVNPLDAFAEVLDRQMQSSAEYKELTAKLATTKDEDERKQLIASAAKIAEGSEIGKILADRQALMAALALRYGAKLREEILGKLDKSSGDTERTSQFIRGTTGSQVQDAANALDRANENAVNSVSGPMGVLAKRVSEAADAFPKLTAALYGATTLGAGVAAGGLGAEGSSIFTDNLPKLLEDLASELVGKMTGTEAVITILGLGLLLCTTYGAKIYLETRKEERLETTRSDERTKAIAAMQFATEAQMQQAEVIKTAMENAGDIANRALAFADRAQEAILKGASKTNVTELGDIHLTRDDAKALTASSRKRASIKIVDQEMKVVDVNTSDPFHWSVVLEDLDSGRQFKMAFRDALIEDAERTKIRDALTARSTLWFKLKAKYLGDELQSYEIMKVIEEPSEG